MKNNTNETITITSETYELITDYVDLLNEISDRYMLNGDINNTEIAHLELARWAVAYKIKEAIDGDAVDLVKDYVRATDRLDIVKNLER